MHDERVDIDTAIDEAARSLIAGEPGPLLRQSVRSRLDSPSSLRWGSRSAAAVAATIAIVAGVWLASDRSANVPTAVVSSPVGRTLSGPPTSSPDVGPTLLGSPGAPDPSTTLGAGTARPTIEVTELLLDVDPIEIMPIDFEPLEIPMIAVDVVAVDSLVMQQ